MTRKIMIGSGGVTADGITWSSRRWIDQTDEEARQFRDGMDAIMSRKPSVPDKIIASAEFRAEILKALEGKK